MVKKHYIGHWQYSLVILLAMMAPSMYWDSVRLLSYSITLKIFNDFELFGLKRQKVELSYGVTIGLAVHRTGYLESIHNNKLVCNENPGSRFPWSIFWQLSKKRQKVASKQLFVSPIWVSKISLNWSMPYSKYFGLLIITDDYWRILKLI